MNELAVRISPALKATSAEMTTAEAPRRHSWLDALRGLAVLFVVFEHLSYHLFVDLRSMIVPWFESGTYGVLLFFLISGYIVPATLERKADVRTFWIGRFFRLYPLWVLALAMTAVLAWVKVDTPPRGLLVHPISAALAHAAMLQDLLRVPNAINVLWTLSYEMTFYLMVSALFVFGLHRRCDGIAVALTAAAVALGGVVPSLWLSRSAGTPVVIACTVAAMIAGLAGAAHRRAVPRRMGALLLAALALCLLVADSRIPVWKSLTILAMMFSGAALYQLDQGRIGRFQTGAVATVVPLAAIACGVTYGPPAERWQWAVTVTAAWATFGAAMMSRRHRMPGALVRLGVISYSVYLLHQLAINLLNAFTGDHHTDSLVTQFGWAMLLGIFLLGLCHLTHRYVEVPAQNFGRHIVRRTAGRSAAAGSECLLLRSRTRM